MKKLYNILITLKSGKTFEINSKANNYQEILKFQYKHNVPIYCCCPGNGTKRLNVKQLTYNNKFYIARWPNTGTEHFYDCNYYSESHLSGRKIYSDGTIKESLDNTIRIKLSNDYASLSNTLKTLNIPHPRHQNKNELKSLSLIGLLNLLWSESRLNYWYPNMEGKRNIFTIHKYILNTSKRIEYKRKKLSDSLVIAIPFNKDNRYKQMHENNSRVLENAIKNKNRLILISKINKFETEKGFIKLQDYFNMPYLNISKEVVNYVNTYFKKEIELLNLGYESIIVTLIEPFKTSKGIATSKVIDVALMSISERFIPVSNIYDLKLEHRLSREQRAFIKLLPFDAPKDIIISDYCLLDTDCNYLFPIIITTSSSTEDKILQKIKIDYFTELYGEHGFLNWDYNAIELYSIPEIPKYLFLKPNNISTQS